MFYFFKLFPLLLLTACQLQPLYNSKQPNNISEYKGISFTPDEGSVENSRFYDYLRTILPISTNPKYTLHIEFSSTNTPIVIQKNSDVLRQSISKTVNYKLIDIKSQKSVIRGSFRRFSSYNISSLIYSSDAERQMASDNLNKQIAEELRARLAFYLK